MDAKLKWLVMTAGVEYFLPAVPIRIDPKHSHHKGEWFGQTPSKLGVDGAVYKIQGAASYSADFQEVREWVMSDWNLLLRTDKVRALTINCPRKYHDDLEEILRQHIGWCPQIRYGTGDNVTWLFRVIGVSQFTTKQVTLAPRDKKLRSVLQQIKSQPRDRSRSVTLHGLGDYVQVWGQTMRGQAIKANYDPDDDDLPVLTAERLAGLWAALCDAGKQTPLFEAWENAQLFAAEHGACDFSRWLHKRRRIRSVDPDGALRVACPIHRLPAARASHELMRVWPAQGDGQPLRMLCSHPGCKDRPVLDFLRLMGYTPGDGRQAPQATLEVAATDPLAKVLADLGAPDAAAITSESGNPPAPATAPMAPATTPIDAIAKWGFVL